MRGRYALLRRTVRARWAGAHLAENVRAQRQRTGQGIERMTDRRLVVNVPLQVLSGGLLAFDGATPAVPASTHACSGSSMLLAWRGAKARL